MATRRDNVIRVLIVDDEPLARKGIRAHLATAPDVEIVGESTNGIQAVEDIRSRAPDIVFLDIKMPGLDGFGVIEKVGVDRMPVIIFVTAYDLHALHAFQVHAVDYLLKPVHAAAFAVALERARILLSRHSPNQIAKTLSALMKQLRTSYPDRFVVKSIGKSVIVPVAEIDWCEAQDDYVCLYARGKKYLLRDTMTTVEAQLDPNVFIRIHRSVIVRLDSIREMKPLVNGDHRIVLRDGKELTMSRTYRKSVMAALNHSP